MEDRHVCALLFWCWMNQPRQPEPSLPTFLGVALLAMVLAAISSILAYVLLDRYSQPSVVVVKGGHGTIVAQISGEVATPGVYPLPHGARLGDLLGAAGGLSDDADLSVLNLAARIGDGESIEIPSWGRASPMSEAIEVAGAPDRVNINTATLVDLEALPGIGPVIAGRIIEYRNANGPFPSVEELVAVEGISDNLLDELRPLVTVDG